jgi:hypothetical protein
MRLSFPEVLRRILVIARRFPFMSTRAMRAVAGRRERIGRGGHPEDGHWRPETSSTSTPAPWCVAIVVPVPHVERSTVLLVSASGGRDALYEQALLPAVEALVPLEQASRLEMILVT